MAHLESNQVTTRQRNTITPLSIAQNLRTASLQKQNIFKEKLDRLSNKISEASNIENMNNKVAIKIAQKTMISQDLSYVLKDHNVFDSTVLDYQKTATFAQVQAVAQKNAQIRNSFFEDEQSELPQLTERFIDQNRSPFILDQSQINEQTSFQAKSIDISIFKNISHRESLSSRENYTDRKPNLRNDTSRSEAKSSMEYSRISQDESQMANLFDKHIINIDKDIDELAQTFYQKSLKERAFKSLQDNSYVDSDDYTDKDNLYKAKVNNFYT